MRITLTITRKTPKNTHAVVRINGWPSEKVSIKNESFDDYCDRMKFDKINDTKPLSKIKI